MPIPGPLHGFQWCGILEIARTSAAAGGEEVPPPARPKPRGEGGRKSESIRLGEVSGNYGVPATSISIESVQSITRSSVAVVCHILAVILVEIGSL